MQNTCCFLGTKNPFSSKDIYPKICSLIEKMITEEKVSLFIIGYSTPFDSIVGIALVNTKERYPYIQVDILPGNMEHISKKCTHAVVCNCDKNSIFNQWIKKTGKNLKTYYLIS